jgi:hypothetical protein
MGEIIKCNFNLFDEGRKYTGHHRNYILESAVKVCYAPETREKISLREALGYLGHGRRVLAGKLALAEVEPVKMPDGSTLIVENVPSNVTVFFECHNDGTIEHHQEILETTPGKVISGLNASKVGGFSWACGGNDGGASGSTSLRNFHGFDYVMNPGFAKNRGYILEDAGGQTREMILESICKSGVGEKEAESYLDSWVKSAQLRVTELEDQLSQAEIYEDALRETIEKNDEELGTIRKSLRGMEDATENRKKLITECASKSVVVVPENVLNALISMADEADFNKIIGFYESASRINLKQLPIDNENKKEEAATAPLFRSRPEYDGPLPGVDFGAPLMKMSSK